MLHGFGRVDNDAEFRSQLRLIAAILLAQWSDTKPDLNGVRGDIFDVATNEQFYQNGYNVTTKGNDRRLWFCSYIGFERISSKWAMENYPGCHGYIGMRIYNQDERHNDLDSHTILFYF
jgi:hypothetical protein